MTPVVLLHGWGMHSGVWSATADVLGERALPVNMPGYGGRATITPYDLPHLAEVIAADLPPVFDLCGWSLGGQVALTLAQLMPERVRRLVLIGVNPCFTLRPDWSYGIAAEVLIEFGNDLALHYESTLKRFLTLQVRGDSAARAVLAQLRNVLFAYGQPDNAVLQAGLSILLQTDLRDTVRRLSTPALIVHGRLDQLAPVAAAEWLAHVMQAAQLQVISGAAHAPFLSHRKEFEDAVRKFLEVMP